MLKDYIRLIAGKRDPAIISEMIDKVDIDKMRTLMSIGISHNSKRMTVKDEILEHYIKAWADSKYDQYIMFGRNLKIDKEINLTMSDKIMRDKINELALKYPQYAILLKSIPSNAYITNKFYGFDNSDSSLSHIYQMYSLDYFTKGCKVSTALSSLIQDEEYIEKKELANGDIIACKRSFDIDLSQIMQTKKIKGRVVLSIDPNDFLMMSTNKHNWKSCMAIAPSCTGYNNTILSKMTDDSTIVGYKASENIYNYNINKFKFNHISMEARYLLFCDKYTGAIGIDHGYGSVSDDLKVEILKFLGEAITDYSEIDGSWSNWKKQTQFSTQSYSLSYNEGVDLCYRHQNMNNYKNIYFRTGVESIICPKCGKDYNYRSYFTCCGNDD